ncbi:MAG: hypothetical protein JWR17_3224 [Pseudomonas sp.]|uniref:dermonecrotic toxin domain-containing protein n=1 Tax=Pseudomonas sp. TaxID=306 RepID=UPI00261F7925|nr:DUF6543 domain-containing protein [Pseudomonas sp.]MDB6050478.1 hypothetical protein [Pseudomonas sp.]
MNEDWNTNDRRALTGTATGITLEHPAVTARPESIHERTDTLASSGAFSQSPFYHTPYTDTPPLQAAPDAVPLLNSQRLMALRKSPAAKLLAGSLLSLQTWQMDLDCPPSLRDYIKQQLGRFLFDNRLVDSAGKGLSPDQLYIHFLTDKDPAIQVDGHEHYALQLSLSDLAMASFDTGSYLALIKCAEPDRPLHVSNPLLTTQSVIEFINASRWEQDYSTLLEAFWARHEATYCVLARLSFVEGLARQYKKTKITLEGYTLALDMLGLDRFPTTLSSLQHPINGERTAISLLSINGQTVPGIFQLKSKLTSHCFIHTLGDAPTTIEYISHDQHGDPHKWLHALNACSWLGLLADGMPSLEAADVSPYAVDGDLFAALTAAQKTFALALFTAQPFEAHSAEHEVDDAIIFKPIERGMAMVSALDLWQPQPDVAKRLPDHKKIAQRLMRSALVKNHQLDSSPDTVFIRYLRGTSTTPLGSAHSPVTYVHTPDETPISLTDALLSNYRVDGPVGYLDNGGRNVVYSDPTAQGVFIANAELAVSAQGIESLIKRIDFLSVITRRFNEFWDRHSAAIDQSLNATFNAQAVIALKMGHISRSGFDMLVRALASTESRPAPVTCQTLGFYLQPSLTEGEHCEVCAGLLVFTDATTALIVLYQAGQVQALVEFTDSDDLDRHIEQSAADKQWRTTLLNYVPVSQHAKLIYVLEVWAGQRIPDPPGSLLTPWTDVIYAEHLHKAKSKTLCGQVLTSSPFAFIRQTLARNHLANATERVVTSREVALRYWTQQLNHLQLLLAPMSLLLTPAMVASIAVHTGSVYLGIEKALLPGNRDTEKVQALLNALSLGLLQLAPFSPRLLRVFDTLTRHTKSVNAAVAVASVPLRSFNFLLRRCINPRTTWLQLFFGTTRLVKTWKIPGNGPLGTTVVQAWKLDRQFLLWTSDQGQARTLVVSTHGYYLPWTKTTAIPNGTELRTYAPHGYQLVDPSLHRVVGQNVEAFSVLNPAGNRLASNTMPPFAVTDTLLAGTSLAGRIKNYSVAKFQGASGESYKDICHVVSNSNLSPWRVAQIPPVPMDVLTVRSRFGMMAPTLQDVFKTLSEHGIHYDRILLLHCRCAAISAALRLSPVYTAPFNGSPPSPGP